MDPSTKTYQIDKHKQLIPLNGTMVNFSCFFEVKSKDNKPFNITIVEQGEIKPKQYKLVDNGYINGQLESDGQLKSYFLVLKAQNVCECDVRVVLKPKEAGNDQSSRQQPQSPISSTPPHQQQSVPPGLVIVEPESYFQTKYIIGISVAAIIMYFLYKHRKSIFGQLTSNRVMPSISSTSF
jgi:hypothetical protein